VTKKAGLSSEFCQFCGCDISPSEHHHQASFTSAGSHLASKSSSERGAARGFDHEAVAVESETGFSAVRERERKSVRSLVDSKVNG